MVGVETPEAGGRRQGHRGSGTAQPVVLRRHALREAGRRPARALPESRSWKRIPQGLGDAVAVARHAEEGGQHQLPGRRQASGARGLCRREPHLEDQLSAGAGQGQGGEAVLAGLGCGGEPHRRGLEGRPHGPGLRQAHLLPDGPLYSPVRQPARRRARTLRLPPARRLLRGHGRQDAATAWPMAPRPRRGRRKGRAAGEAEGIAGPETPELPAWPTAAPQRRWLCRRSQRASSSDAHEPWGQRRLDGGDGVEAGRFLPVRDRPPGEPAAAEVGACCPS